MNVHANPPAVDFQGDASLGALLAALRPHDERRLVLEHEGRAVQPGYHVTEVKAGTFLTLDCGGQPDAWSETILQVEDLPAEAGRTPMTVGRFRSILDTVSQRVALRDDARLTLEVGRPGVAMQIFDVGELSLSGAEATLRLVPRAAICKPRHRAAQAAAPCCTPSGARSSCG